MEILPFLLLMLGLALLLITVALLVHRHRQKRRLRFIDPQKDHYHRLLKERKRKK